MLKYTNIYHKCINSQFLFFFLRILHLSQWWHKSNFWPLNDFRWRCERFSRVEEGRHRCSNGYRWFGRVEAGGRHDSARWQFRLDRDRCRGGSIDLRQPEEIHRVHPHLEHPRDLTLPGVHPLRHPSASRYRYYSLHRLGNGHGESLYITRIRAFRSSLSHGAQTCSKRATKAKKKKKRNEQTYRESVRIPTTPRRVSSNSNRSNRSRCRWDSHFCSWSKIFSVALLLHCPTSVCGNNNPFRSSTWNKRDLRGDISMNYSVFERAYDELVRYQRYPWRTSMRSRISWRGDLVIHIETTSSTKGLSSFAHLPEICLWSFWALSFYTIFYLCIYT